MSSLTKLVSALPLQPYFFNCTHHPLYKALFTPPRQWGWGQCAVLQMSRHKGRDFFDCTHLPLYKAFYPLPLKFLIRDCHFKYTLNVSEISISPVCGYHPTTMTHWLRGSVFEPDPLSPAGVSNSFGPGAYHADARGVTPYQDIAQ